MCCVFWKVNDENDMLPHSLARLSDDVKADYRNVSTTSEPNRNVTSNKTNEKC